MTDEPEIECPDRKTWRSYLRKNHKKADAVWIVHYKKHTGIPSLTFQEAVAEALCFGWIDGKVQRIDDDRYRRRFTPRRPGSIWSLVNKNTATELIAAGAMTKAGLKQVQIAKENGQWEAAYSTSKDLPVPKDLKAALSKNKKAETNFNNFAPSYRRDYIRWIEDAKQAVTRKRRIGQVVERSRDNKKPGVA